MNGEKHKPDALKRHDLHQGRKTILIPPTRFTVRFLASLFLFTGSMATVGLVDQRPASADDEATVPSQDDSASPLELRVRALKALQEGDNEAAIEAADAMVQVAPEDMRVVRIAGDVLLRAGETKRSTKLFNRYVAAHPDHLPELWQRGIALYFSGDYTAAAKQFEVHRTVNPNDVENAAWHFLCVAKAKSVEEAKRLVLPAPNDPRVPMQEVLEMLSSGDTESVEARMKSVPEGTNRRASADFYGDFYLGLYADALGEPAKALEYLERSAKDAPRNYMGDVARVYAEFLAKKQRH